MSMNILGLPSGSDNSLLQAGSGISYNAQTGTITNSGVRYLTGTSNQILQDAYTGSITLSLPQDIDTSSNVQFNQATLGSTLKFNNGASDISSLVMNGGAGSMAHAINGNWSNNLASGLSVDFKNASSNSIFKIQENGGMIANAAVKLNDNCLLNMGDSLDFTLYHDGTSTNYIKTGAGRDLVFNSETTSAFNYKFQNHAGADLFKITGAGAVSIPGFSTANRILATTNTSGTLGASLAYDSANTASAIVQRASDGAITVGKITTEGGVSTFNSGFSSNQIVLNNTGAATNRLNIFLNNANARDFEIGLRGSGDTIPYMPYAYSNAGSGGGSSTWVYLCDSSMNLKTNSIYPLNDNSVSCGKSGNRWSEVWAGVGAINTSDQRKKENITTSNLGLNFINLLNPVSYKFKDYTSTSAADKDGNTTTINHTYSRIHYGLISQEVKTVLDGLNISTNDFAGYIYDQASDLYALRYDEFISPLIKAVQELNARLVIAENKLIAHNIT